MTEIPQEAIEAAAVVIASQFDTGPMPVDDTDRQYATEVLEAALPFLRSQWEQERAADRSAGWTEAEYMASPDLASRLHGRILDLLFALAAIRDYDSFQGGPIAPRATPTENALRRVSETCYRTFIRRRLWGLYRQRVHQHYRYIALGKVANVHEKEEKSLSENGVACDHS